MAARRGALGRVSVRALASLLAEVVDLKRVSTPGGRFAEDRFLGAWAALCAGDDPRALALTETAAAVCACRLGAIDEAVLRRAGLTEAEARDVRLRAFDEVADPIGEPLRTELRGAAAAPAASAGGGMDVSVGQGDTRRTTSVAAPAFARRLAAQPRAGATRPGHPRLMLAPAETHAEHCWVVAVGGVLAASHEGADPTVPFLAGLAHHLHNAALPDAGFTGESLLGDHLDAVLATLREQALAELPGNLRIPVADALAVIPKAETPEARAFHTADVLDRVLEMRWHARTAVFTLDAALDELDLVHEGPLQAFGLEVVDAAGLR